MSKNSKTTGEEGSKRGSKGEGAKLESFGRPPSKKPRYSLESFGHHRFFDSSAQPWVRHQHRKTYAPSAPPTPVVSQCQQLYFSPVAVKNVVFTGILYEAFRIASFASVKGTPVIS